MHLTRQHNVWTFRRRIPRDLQERFGKREIYKSLATSCRRVARRKAALLFVATEELFELARDEDLTPDELAAIARHWLDEQTDLKRKIDSLPPGRLATYEPPDPWPRYRPLGYPMSRDEHRAARARQKEARLASIISNAGYEATPSRIAAVETALKQAVDDYVEQRRKQIFHPEQVPASSGGAAGAQQPTGPRASELKEPFAEQAIAEGRWRQQTRAQNLNSIDLLIRICGDKAVGAYTRADAEKLRRTLEKIPANYGKSPRHYRIPIEQVVAEKRPETRTLGVGTLDRHWNTIVSFFRWANRLDGVTPIDLDRVFGGFRWSADVPEAQERIPWDDDSLATLFLSPIWTGFQPHPRKPNLRHLPGDTIVRDHRFWLPILGIYTGARLEELAQLQHGDVQEIDGIPVLRITDEGEGQKLKTKSSRRMVPMHSELIRLGFLEHVKLIAASPTARIFPEIKRGGRDNSLSHYYTEEFTKYRREIGVYRPLMDFHSFRHNATTAMMRAGVDLLVVDQVTGHDSQSRREIQEQARTRGAAAGASISLNYFAGFTLPQLRDAVETIRYPTVDLSRHYVNPPGRA